MDKEYFVSEIKRLRDSAAKSCIKVFEKPPGRGPRQKDVEISNFYNSLDEKSKEFIYKMAKECIDQALFSFFCILDHVRFIEDTEDVQPK